MSEKFFVVSYRLERPRGDCDLDDVRVIPYEAVRSLDRSPNEMRRESFVHDDITIKDVGIVRFLFKKTPTGNGWFEEIFGPYLLKAF